MTRYLDLEAAVDDEEDIDTDGEEELERLEMFINDEELCDEEELNVSPVFVEDDFEEEEDESSAAFDALLAKVRRNAQGRTNPYRPRRDEEEMDQQMDKELEDQLAKNVGRMDSQNLERMDRIMREPTVDDAPLFRVACRPGAEENIVFNLMRMLVMLNPDALSKYELRSAFAPSHLRGYIYLECKMNKHLTELLQKTAGIHRTRQGLVYQLIPLNERPRLLCPPKDNRSIIANQWVRIRKGLYKGDIGLVSDVQPCGRKAKPTDDVGNTADGKDMGNQKRKRDVLSVRNPPKLFIPEEPIPNTRVRYNAQDRHYFVGRLKFSNGLLFKWFDFSALDVDVFEMPWSLSKLFAEALRDIEHIDLKERPRPQEWIFFEGEKVIVGPSKKLGIILKAERRYVQVEYNNKAMDVVSWYNLRKEINVGDFVKVLNGSRHGYEGWVIALEGDEARVCDKVPNPDHDGPIDGIMIQLNRLHITNVPFHFAQESTESPSSRKTIISLEKCGSGCLWESLGSLWGVFENSLEVSLVSFR
ncbi:hypothetical protein BJ912DRAFT_930712 [Pholiota molesta]|nr:hypothetical protein BJ912DRAFT_930712 [Pholiota molesta]